MRNTLETRLGIFFAITLIAAILVVEIIGGLDFFRTGIRVHALFEQVQELKPGDPVKLGGVQIGRVDEVGFADQRVQITMKIERHQEMVKTDSIASIRYVGLMGQNFIAIEFGSPAAPPVESGVILESREQPDLATLMSRLDEAAAGVQELTVTLAPDTMHNLIGPFTDFLRENAPMLSTMVANLTTVSAQIAQGEGSVGKLVMQDDFYQQALAAASNLNESTADLQGTLAQARSVVDNIAEGRGTLGLLAHDEALYAETTSAMTTLGEILEKINVGEGTVGRLVTDDALFRNARMTLQKVDRATEGLEDQGPLSVLGIVVNSLF